MTSSHKHRRSPPSAPGESATPGKPKDSGSRQQTYPDQNSQTGSPTLDRKHTDRGGTAPPPKPPGAK
jgi:hypothetical protein